MLEFETERSYMHHNNKREWMTRTKNLSTQGRSQDKYINDWSQSGLSAY